MSDQRLAEPGEVCTCGRPAVVVFLGGRYGDTGWCGVSDAARKPHAPFVAKPSATRGAASGTNFDSDSN
jgi:hypothetical protein